MSWLYSQALVAASSAGICSGGNASGPSKSTPTAPECWYDAKTKVISRLSRYGITCKPLPGGTGRCARTSGNFAAVAVRSLFRVGSPARISALREAAMVWTEKEAAFGLNSLASLARYDRPTSSWRTRQYLLSGEFTEFSGTWPRSGIIRHGECWELSPLAEIIFDTGSGLLPTAVANIDKRKPKPGWTWNGKYWTDANGRKIQSDLRHYVEMYPTPLAQEHKQMDYQSSYRKDGRKLKTFTLTGKVKHLESETGKLPIGKLNPDWIEWLMGWPIGWSALKPLETARFREWLRKHGGS